MYVLTAGSLLAGSPPIASAQVSAVRDMTFGTLLRGTTLSIAPTAANAAEWKVSGILLITSSITFTLPTTLTRVGGGGTLPIAFCTACGVYRVNNTDPSGGTAFNPNTGIIGLTISILSNIYIWLGASIEPAANQATGSYTGSIIMTVNGLL